MQIRIGVYCEAAAEYFRFVVYLFRYKSLIVGNPFFLSCDPPKGLNPGFDNYWPTIPLN